MEFLCKLPRVSSLFIMPNPPHASECACHSKFCRSSASSSLLAADFQVICFFAFLPCVNAESVEIRRRDILWPATERRRRLESAAAPPLNNDEIAAIVERIILQREIIRYP